MSEKPPAFTDDFLIRQFKTNPPGKYTVALLGTALFGRFRYYTAHDRDFKENPCILNLGGSLGADKIRNVRRLIDKGFLRCLKQNQPNLKVIYLQIGDGDITEDGLPQSDVKAYCIVVASLREKFPKAQIVITSFFQQHGLSERAIGKANDALRHITACSGDAVLFLPFRANQREIMSDDQINLTNDGYRKWYNFIQNDINNR